MLKPKGAQIIALRRYRLKTVTIRTPLLVVVRQGRKILENPRARIQAGAGMAVLIQAGTTWNVTNDPAGAACYEAWLFDFSGLALPAPALHTPPPAAQALPVDALLREALERTHQSPLSPALLQHRLQEVLLILGENGYALTAPQPKDWGERIRTQVEQHPGEDWSAARLAHVLHVSESTLRRRLAQNGLALGAWVREIRLEAALFLLQTTTQPIGAIAQHCGWQSHSRFSAAFAARWGVSPGSVRRVEERDYPQKTDRLRTAHDRGGLKHEALNP